MRKYKTTKKEVTDELESSWLLTKLKKEIISSRPSAARISAIKLGLEVKGLLKGDHTEINIRGLYDKILDDLYTERPRYENTKLEKVSPVDRV